MYGEIEDARGTPSQPLSSAWRGIWDIAASCGRDYIVHAYRQNRRRKHVRRTKITKSG